MDLDDCFRKGLIRQIVVDEGLVKSLVEMSEIKESAVRTAKITDMNVSAYVSLAYDSLRELLEAVCVSRGFKVLSHVCVGELLRREVEVFDYDEFDRLRYVRNSVNYYGVKIGLKQGRGIIGKIFAMNNNVKRIFQL